MMPDDSANRIAGRVVTAAESRRAASYMHWGNMVSMLLPIPLVVFWFGASMLVYAMNRHHPNANVGKHTQQGAYRFYGVTGLFTAVAIFFPGGGGQGWWWPYVISWGLAAAVLVPWSIFDLVRIYREPWCDTTVIDKEGLIQGDVL